MSILTWIEDQKRQKVLNAPKYVNPDEDSSKGLWTRCDKCGVILYIKHLKENQRVCFGCSYHLQMSSQERIESLLDKSSWGPLDETVSPCDPLEFHDQKKYTDRLQDAQEKTGLQDAVQTGTGMIDGIPVALGVMDFSFMGGSMGSVVGEKITRLIEYATQEGLTLLIVCASGGARMQEGVFSLMQMAKVSSALQIYQSCANLLYISILTSPTTGGVTASFAMLGDIIFSEPKALIAFAGRRVIEQTLREDLPDDFQSSEYMLHHGLVDLIVPRRFLRQALSESIRLYQKAPFKIPGRIPFGVQNPITFLTEEKVRRSWGDLTSRKKKNQVGKGSFQNEANTSRYGSNTLRNKLKQALLLKPREKVQNKTDSNYLLNYLVKEFGLNELVRAPQLSEDSLPGSKHEQVSLHSFSSLGGFLTKNGVEKEFHFPKKGSEEVHKKHALTSGNDIEAASYLYGRNLDPNTYTLETQRAPQRVTQCGLESQLFQEEVSRQARQSIEYREILTSFEMIFELFSRESYIVSGKDYFLLAESAQKYNTAGALPFLQQNQDQSYEKSQETEIDYLNQAIAMAATESIEWKAFYLDQNLSKKTGFLEDFIQPSFSETLLSLNQEELLAKKAGSKAYTREERDSNFLFYKSICRSSILVNR